MKMPLVNDAERCLELRKRGKRGQYLSPEDSKFCLKMFKQFPEWYSKTEARVFNETVPFGSNMRKKEEI